MDTTSEKTRLYTYDEAARKLNVSPGTMRHWTRQGIIPFRRIGRRTVRFTDADIAEIIGAPLKGDRS